MLKYFKHLLSQFLIMTALQLLSLTYFLRILEIGKIIPVQRFSDPGSASNWRPMWLSCALRETIKHTVFYNSINYVDNNQLFVVSNAASGCSIPVRNSCSTLLNIYTLLRSKYAVCCRVDTLLRSLSYCTPSPTSRPAKETSYKHFNTVSWIPDFLSNRTQKT